MKKLHLSVSLLLAACLILSLAACTSTGVTEAPEAASDQPAQQSASGAVAPKNGSAYNVGYSVGEMNHPLNAYTVLLFEERANQLGIEFTVTDGEGKSDKQIDDISALIQKNIDALLVLPTDGVAVAPGVEEAAAAGIPVFVVLRDMPTVSHLYTTFCGSDDIDIGRLAAIWTATVLEGSGNVVFITGTPGLSTAEDRTQGFHQVIDNYPDISIVAEQTAKYQRAEAMTVMEGILQANSQIDVVFAANDEMAGGACQAINAAGRDGIKVIGVNFQQDGHERLMTGEQAADITTPPQMVLNALDSAMEYLAGNQVPKANHVSVDIVTRDNAWAFEDQLY